ncbi:MAG: hypothetical protein KatS3mg022_2806 [Armatimonadota bacterium]|nr:MAG: hypothetical protein KatS3mg022_2806 [Armatimonadota bacterium]
MMREWEEEEKLWEGDEIVRQLGREQNLEIELGRLVRTVHTVLTLWCDRQFEALSALTKGRELSAEQLEALWQETRQIMQGKPVVPRLEMLLESIVVSVDTHPPSTVWLVSLVLWKETNFWPFVEDTPGRLYLLLRDSITELYDVSIVRGEDYFKRKYG